MGKKLFFASLLWLFSALFLTLTAQDTLLRKEQKRDLRLQRRLELKESHQRTFIKGAYMLAFLHTTATFEIAGGILNARLDLEKNFGLSDRQFFFTGSFLHRFTPKSGTYLEYYGINRSKSSVLKEDVIFLRDTIPAGTSIESFFRTKVVSLGYLYTLVENPNAFLGCYLNIYLMNVRTGVKSEFFRFDEEVGITAPVPALGVLGLFKITPWLKLDAGVGYFSLDTRNFGGRVNNLNARLNFHPLRWLGVSLGYQEFDVEVYFPSDDVNTIIEYHFAGRTAGLAFVF